MTSDVVLFQVEKDDSNLEGQLDPNDSSAGRYIRYKFPAAFLDLSTIGAS